MKKRVLSALLVLCMACSMVSTVWANPAASDGTEPVQKNVASSQALDETGAADGSEETQSGDSELVLSDTTADEKETGAATGSEETAPISGDESMEPDGDIADSTTESDDGSNLPATSQPNNSIANESDTPNLLADGTYNIYYGETIQLNGQNSWDDVNHRWSQKSEDGGQIALTNDRGVATIKGTHPGTVTVTHTYFAWVQDHTETFTVHVSDQALVFVYVAARVTNQDGTPVTDKYGNQLSWADNPEFLEMLGLDPNTVDGYGYFPVGQVLVPYEGLLDQDSPYLNDENDWSVVTNALENLETNALNNTYAANRGNSIADYRQQAIHDFNFEGSQQRSALFETSGSSNGFDRQAGYHLDLRFRTNTITFVAADNGLDDDSYGQYKDLSTLGYRVYITGATIEEPEGIGAPDGYTIDGYYTDKDCTQQWAGVGTPLENDVTVYVKYTERANVTINYTAIGLEGTAADAVTPASETFNPAKNPTGSTATAPDGYKFVGWYSDETCETSVGTANTFVPTAPEGGWEDGKTYTYYAKFEKLEPLNLDHSKYVKANKDGTFDLTLDVTGSVEDGQVQTQQVDVLMIVDKSGSMGITDHNNNVINDNAGNIVRARDAVKTLITTLESKNTTGEAKVVDARYSVIAFSGRNEIGASGGESDASLTADWQENSLELVNKIEALRAKGGTDYEAALVKAKEQLAEAEKERPQSTKIVVFLSDGAPTWSLEHGNGRDNLSVSDNGWQDTLETAKEITCDKFYAIAIGNDFSIYLSDTTTDYWGQEQYNQYGLVNAVNAETKDFLSVGTDYNDDTTLSKIFADIANEATSIDCSNVKITDTLSQYAKLTENAAFSVKITAGNQPVTVTPASVSVQQASQNEGANVSFQAGQETITLTVKYDADEGKFSLTFPNDYALDDGWTYSITTQIEPTEQAYTDYRTNIATEGNNGYGETVGDPGTDAQGNTTSSNQPGFYSNSSAKLTYISNGVSADKDYARPVIQVTTGTLNLEKAVNVDAAKDQNFTFTITKLDGDTDSKDNDFTYTFGSVNFTEGVASVTVQGGQTLSMTGLPSGRYTVAENDSSMPSVNGYNLTGTTYQVEGEDASNTPVTVQVNAAGATSVTVTNTYAPQYQTLTVTKMVGGEMGSYEQDFTFTLHLTKDDATYTGDDITGTKSLLNGTGTVLGGVTKITEGDTTCYQFTLKHNQKIEIQIPYGCVAEVEEANGNYTAESVLDTSTNKGGATVTGINMSTDHKVAYTNTLDPVAPTGLESNHTTPYVLMITAAGMAGLALIGGIVARRVRRRRQE